MFQQETVFINLGCDPVRANGERENAIGYRQMRSENIAHNKSRGKHKLWRKVRKKTQMRRAINSVEFVITTTDPKGWVGVGVNKTMIKEL